MKHIASLSGWILALGVTLVGAACGSVVEEVSAGASSGAGGNASSSSEAGTTATGAGGDGQGGQGTSNSATTGAGGQGTGGAAPGDVTPKLVGSSFWISCFLPTGPDPVVGNFTATYTNSGTLPASATITSAKGVMTSGPKTLSWPLTVSPASGGPVQPGATLSLEHQKQTAPGSVPEGNPCDFCDSTWTLTVTWDLGGGKTAVDTLPGEKIGCVY